MKPGDETPEPRDSAPIVDKDESKSRLLERRFQVAYGLLRHGSALSWYEGLRLALATPSPVGGVAISICGRRRLPRASPRLSTKIGQDGGPMVFKNRAQSGRH